MNATTSVRYPQVRVPLQGMDGNAFAIIGTVQSAMKRAKLPQSVCDEFRAEATSGDYNHLLQTVMRWVDVTGKTQTEVEVTRDADCVELELPAGTYRIGDPCYSVPDDRWSEWLDAAGLDNAKDHLLADLDGHLIVGLFTLYGDGEYIDQRIRRYGVDAGLIGMVPVDLPGLRSDYGTDEEAAATGVYHVETFESPVRVRRFKDGTLEFGSIAIFTGDEEEDEEGCIECGDSWCDGDCADEEGW